MTIIRGDTKPISENLGERSKDVPPAAASTPPPDASNPTTGGRARNENPWTAGKFSSGLTNVEAGITSQTSIEPDFETELAVFTTIEEVVDYLRRHGKDRAPHEKLSEEEVIVGLAKRWEAQHAKLDWQLHDMERLRKAEANKKGEERKSIDERRERFSEYQELRNTRGKKEDIAKAHEKAGNLLKEIRSEMTGRGYHGIAELNDTEFMAKLEEYFKGGHIFENGWEDIRQAYAFLEYTENRIVRRLGHEIFPSGSVPVNIDLSQLDVNELIRENIPPKAAQAAVGIASQIRELLTREGVEKAGAEIGILIGELAGTGAFFHFADLGNRLQWLTHQPAEITEIGFVIGLTVVLRHMIGRSSRVVEAMPEAQAGSQYKFSLKLQHTGLSSPLDKNDPVSLVYVGDPPKAFAFVERSISARARVLGVFKLSASEASMIVNPGDVAIGRGIPYQHLDHRIAFASHMEDILAALPLDRMGRRLSFDELPPHMQNKASQEAFDLACADMFEREKNTLHAIAALRKMQGDGKWADSAGSLAALIKEYEAHKVAFFPKEAVMTLEQAKEALAALQGKEHLLDSTKALYAQRHPAILEKWKSLDAATQAYGALVRANGEDEIREGGRVTKPATGKIGRLRTELSQAKERIPKLKDELQIGVKDGLDAKYKNTKSNLGAVERNITNLEERRTQAQAMINAINQSDRYEDDVAKTNARKPYEGAIETIDLLLNGDSKTPDVPGLRAQRTSLSAQLDTFDLEQDYTAQRTEYDKLIGRVKAIQGEIHVLADAVEGKRGDEETARVEFDHVLTELKDIMHEFGYSDEDLRRAVPTIETFNERVEAARRKMAEEKARLEEIKEKGRKVTELSPEDKRNLAGMKMLLSAMHEQRITEFMLGLYTGNIDVRTLTSGNNEGYQRILMLVIGPEALAPVAPGNEGGYPIASRVLSKARLFDAAEIIFGIRDGSTGFFAGNSEANRLFHHASNLEVEMAQLNQEIARLAGNTNSDIVQRVTEMRKNLLGMEGERDKELGLLYDQYIVPRFAADRISMGACISMAIQSAHEDARRGNVFAKTSLEAVSGPDVENIQTPVFAIRITGPKAEDLSGRVAGRGTFKVETVRPGVGMEVRLTNRVPVGDLEVNTTLDLNNHELFDSFPSRPPARLPPELAIIYGVPGRWKSAIDSAHFTQSMYDSLPATIEEANRMGITNTAFVNYIYNPTQGNHRKRPLSDIQRSNLAMGEVRENELRGLANTSLMDLLTHYDGPRKLDRPRTDLMPESLRDNFARQYPTRKEAEGNLRPVFIKLFYGSGTGPDDNILALNEIRRLRLSRDDIAELPMDGSALRGSVPDELLKVFYEERHDLKRSRRDMEAFLDSLPQSRPGNIPEGLTNPAIRAIYAGEPGMKRQAAEVLRMNLERTFNDVSDLSGFIRNGLALGGNRADNLFFTGVAESFALIENPLTREAFAGDHFKPQEIGDRDATGSLRVEAGDSGVLNITYSYKESGNRVLTDKLTFEQFIKNYIANRHDPTWGGFIRDNPFIVQDCLNRVGMEILDAARRRNI